MKVEEEDRVYSRKLVRDKIPDIIKKSGGKYKIRVLNNESMLGALSKKLVEEVGELIDTDNREQLLREAADVAVTLLAILDRHEYSIHDLNRELKKNVEKKGKFSKQLYLIWSTKIKT